MFTYIAYEHIHLAPAAQVLSTHNCQQSFVQLSNLPANSTGTATFCLIIKKLYTCHECQQHISLDM